MSLLSSHLSRRKYDSTHQDEPLNLAALHRLSVCMASVLFLASVNCAYGAHILFTRPPPNFEKSPLDYYRLRFHPPSGVPPLDLLGTGLGQCLVGSVCSPSHKLDRSSEEIDVAPSQKCQGKTSTRWLTQSP